MTGGRVLTERRPAEGAVAQPCPRGAGAATLLGIVLFALVGVGGPLVGAGVFAATDEMVQHSPYRDAGLAGEVQNTFLDDTWDTIIPNTLLFAEALRAGEIAAWNPYLLGGVPLGATPNFAVASPLTVPYYLLPGWLAPAWVKAVEIAVAVGGCFLYARRCGLARAPALLGGLVFASSAFMIAWTNWPQTRTAAVIPFLFWALERIVQRRRAGDAAILAVAVAAMLFGGFPAVTGYALLAAAAYLVVRLSAEHRAGTLGADGRALVAAGVGVLGGLALAAVQLLPFVAQLSTALVEGRAQTPADHLPHEALITALAPSALGTVEPDDPPPFLLDVNMVEALSYVGAAALVLVVVAVAAVRPARALLPRGVWAFLVVTSAVLVVLAYAGGPPLAAAQQLPTLFADNYVGRVRSVLGFLLGILAAVGFAVLLRPRGAGDRRRAGLLWGTAVWAAAAVAGAWLWREARWAADAVDDAAGDGVGRLAHLDREVTLALGVVAVALLCAVALRAGRAGWLRAVAAALLPLLIAGQALTLVRDYWPRSERDTFYPVTDVHRFLADGLGHERYAFALGGMAVGADAPQRLRSLNGHTFVHGRFGDLVEALPGRQFGDPPTLPVLTADPAFATAPVLDRLGVRYYVTSPAHPVFGVETAPDGDGSGVTLVPGVPVSAPVTAGAPVRGITVTPAGPVPRQGPARLEVVLRDGDGDELARGSRSRHGIATGKPFTVPFAEPAGAPASVEITLRGPAPLRVQGAGGAPAVGAVLAGDDGLELVFAGNAVVYERASALPRIRWASRAVVEPDPQRRVDLVASGTLGPDAVVLDAPAARAGGGGAGLAVTEDGIGEVVVEVAASTAGYLVVADALQHGWRVEVDGEPAELLAADHGLVAVAVPAGAHVVRWHHSSTAVTAGAATSGIAALALVVVVGLGLRRAAGRGGAAAKRYPRRDPAGNGR